MWEDPVIKKTRELRAKYAAKFKHDPDALFEDIKKRQEKSERKLVKFPPRRLKSISQIA